MTNTTDTDWFDAVVVGAAISGSLVARQLTRAGLKVLLLAVGPGTPATFDGYTEHLEHFFAAAGKGPESPSPPATAAPQSDTADLHSGQGYFVQNGPQQYGSSYTRLRGRSTLHWLRVCLRMRPEDFELPSRYGVGADWPLGYVDLEPYYPATQHEIGVAADVADQAHQGVEFPSGYEYPMQGIPPSYPDQTLAAAVTTPGPVRLPAERPPRLDYGAALVLLAKPLSDHPGRNAGPTFAWDPGAAAS